MEIKEVRTGGISYISPVEGSGNWYWGCDRISNDLYEARELYELRHETDRNRLILITEADGTVYEPVKAEQWQFFGKPVYDGKRICFPAVRFAAKKIRIFAFDTDTLETQLSAELPLESAGDCYNLALHVHPLTLSAQRQGALDLIWPETAHYSLGAHETFVCRNDDLLICSEWFEDPGYREETVLRRVQDGSIVQRMNGTVYQIGNQFRIIG